jgi:hypothetical protein
MMVNLPKQVGPWARQDTPKRVEPQAIFNYMDGGGELYLAYRFDHLDVYEYTSSDQGSILVELYWMKSPDDAFGLLSNDWGGEPTDIGAKPEGSPVTQVPSARALFGSGLLRLWSDNLYARVLASRDTPASREQVIALGRAVAAGRAAPPVPALIRALPVSAASDYQLRPNRVSYLRSYLVLNTAFFLASEDILDLNHQVDAVTVQYASPSQPGAGTTRGSVVQAVVAVYPTAAAATAALTHFRKAYLPEASGSVPDASRPEAVKVEQGWVGDGQQGRAVVIVLDCPDEAIARRMVGDLASHAGGGQP